MLGRRSVLTLTLGALTSACSDSPLGRISDTVLLASGVSNKADADFERVKALPYASMAVKLGISPLSSVILGQVEGEDLYWYTADRAILVTRNGRLVRTAGFPENLLATRNLTLDPLAHGRFNGQSSARRLIDMEKPRRYGVSLSSEFEIGESRRMDIYGRSLSLTRIVEHCSVPAANWEFENIFWVASDTGMVWKSEQYALPHLPPFEMTVVKPAQT